MDELNQHESDNLTALITLILEQAKWLARALIVSGLLCMASLVPVLSGPLLSILLTAIGYSTEVGHMNPMGISKLS